MRMFGEPNLGVLGVVDANVLLFLIHASFFSFFFAFGRH